MMLNYCGCVIFRQEEEKGQNVVGKSEEESQEENQESRQGCNRVRFGADDVPLFMYIATEEVV